MRSFTSLTIISPVAFIIAFLGFFLTFTDINCNGEKIDSVSGFEFVKGYSAEENDDSVENEKYNPNLFLLIAFVIGFSGFIFYFIKKLGTNYKLLTLMAIIAFACMLLFMVELKDSISSVDPEENLNKQTYVDLDAEMKFGYWLVTGCFLLAAVWNWMKWKSIDIKSEESEIEIV